MISVAAKTNINELFETQVVGWAFVIASVGGTANRATFSCAMAIFRIMYIKAPAGLQKIGESRFAIILICLCVIGNSILTYLWISGSDAASISVLNFARGQSKAQALIHQKYLGEEHDSTVR